ncbi:YggT family protein [Ktedonospora formicarum]|uniref:YggT family protein n=1 Tax=Ktedonospora formicarum TaxID=2778364 RepID=A0A8J3MR58_9CHLR|nr:YggT family protein [Ktedonospora formicarum]GHO44695.1 hypothetical protein KSX_28580 [Ktedonospora formicarum]
MPFPILHIIVLYGIDFLIISMIIRMIASWFNIDERNGFIRFFTKVTDPFIKPIRRFVKPIGMFDIAFILAWFMLAALNILLSQALPANW